MNASRNLLALILLSITTICAVDSKNRPQPETFIAGGDAKMQQGRYLDAIEQYSKAIKIDKRNPNYFQSRAQAELAASKFKQAVGDASKSIKFAPDDANGYELRAKAYDKLEDYKKEHDDLDKLISLRPNTGVYLLQRAQTSVELKQMELVIKDCNAAITLGLDRGQLAELYKMRAIAYKKLGKKTEAQQETNKYESLR